MDELDLLKSFLEKVKKQGERKSKLYDGINSRLEIDPTLRLSIEELGEIATAITRDRYGSAMDECVDLAHCAFLIYSSILRKIEQERV